MAVKSDIEIAREAKMKPIAEVGKKIGIPADALLNYGPTKAKVSFDFINGVQKNKDGKLILVTAISPTPAGEGKTTTTVGLGDGLNRIGKKAMSCLREPSLGPCFGMKGGAAGGGYAQVVPMEDINLHFTGDFHAITSRAQSAVRAARQHIYWGNPLGLDARRIAWRRVMDMNDRALRSIVNSLGGTANGFPREDGFDITVASEVMAIFCLATDLKDLERRIGNIVVGYTRDRKPVKARDLKGDGAMTVLLKDALMPNLVQTLENNPVFIHGGPFANIAHGCNSVLATKTALKLCRLRRHGSRASAPISGRRSSSTSSAARPALLPPPPWSSPPCARSRCMAASPRTISRTRTSPPSPRAATICKRHLENVRKFGVPPVVAINRFITDTDAELQEVMKAAESAGTQGLPVHALGRRRQGHRGTGAARGRDVRQRARPSSSRSIPTSMPLRDKVKTIATEIYRASDIVLRCAVEARFKELQDGGYGHLPVCMAKTQYSFSTNPNLRGAPTGHMVPVRELRLSAGAEFVVVITGEIMTMPGLPTRAVSADEHPPQRDGPDRRPVLDLLHLSEVSKDHLGSRSRLLSRFCARDNAREPRLSYRATATIGRPRPG